MTPEQFGAKQAAKIEAALAALEEAANKAQDASFNEVSALLKELDSTNGVLDNSAENYRKLSKLKTQLNDAILTDQYSAAVVQFAKIYNTIALAQNDFYSQIEQGYEPGQLNDEVRRAAIDNTIQALSESGIDVNIISKVEQVLRDGVSTNARYIDVIKSLNELMTNTDAGEGLLVRYIKTYSIDSINVFARNYNQVITADIGFDWFVYSGSNIDTTREFCLHMSKKRYFHASEIPKLLTGNIDGEQVPLNDKTGLPQGMKAETNRSNFQTLAGGWNCGHQILGTAKEFVPDAIRSQFD